MASSGHTISSDALRNFRYHYLVRFWGKKVFFLVYKHIFLVGQSKTIREILEDNNVPLFSVDAYSFTTNEIKELLGKPEDLDITLMNKICWKLWDVNVGFPGKRLKNLMTKIKNERNNVSHKDYKLSQTELEWKIKCFQNTLEETLDAAKSVWSLNGVKIDVVKIDQMKLEIKDAVPNLLEKIRETYDPTNHDELQKLQDEIKGFWYHLSEYILQLSQNELKSLYGLLSQICPYDWLAQYGVTDPCNSTISLKMDQQMEFHRCHKSMRGIVIDQREILDSKDKSGKEAIIISGCAGSGKTTMLCCILEKWIKGNRDMPNLSSFEVVLYMQFKNHSHDNFDDYLRSLFPQTSGLFNLEHIKSAIMRSKCLILCDGYDEADDSSRKLFVELLTLNFKDRKVVVTTRAGETETVTTILNKAKYDRINLSILGLRDEDMKPLIEKITTYLIKDDVTRRAEMKKELFQLTDRMDETMIAILKTPLYFNLFILLFIDSPDFREKIRNRAINSSSTLYIQLEEHKQKRIIKNSGIKSEFLKQFDALYLKYSIQNYNESKYELSQTDVDVMKSETQCQEVTDNFDSLLSSYFTIKHSTENIGITKVYCYRHASELEFAAARKISVDICKSYSAQAENIVESVLIANGIWQMLTKKGSERGQMINLLTFTTGILYNMKRNVLYSVIDDLHILIHLIFPGEFDFLLIPYIETGFDPKVLGSLLLVLKSTLPIKELGFCVSKVGSVYALPQLLPKLKPEYLKIQQRCGSLFGNSSDIDFPLLEKAVEVASNHRIPVKLFLKMDLTDIAHLREWDSQPVDELELWIYDDQKADLDKLCPLPILSKDLHVTYWGKRENILDISHVLNAVWPRRDKKDISETKIKGEISSSPSSSEEESLEVRSPVLTIWTEDSEEVLPLLLKSLTVQPLRRLQLPNCDLSNREIIAELSTECMEMGFGKLEIAKDYAPDDDGDVDDDDDDDNDVDDNDEDDDDDDEEEEEDDDDDDDDDDEEEEEDDDDDDDDEVEYEEARMMMVMMRMVKIMMMMRRRRRRDITMTLKWMMVSIMTSMKKKR